MVCLAAANRGRGTPYRHLAASTRGAQRRQVATIGHAGWSFRQQTFNRLLESCERLGTDEHLVEFDFGGIRRVGCAEKKGGRTFNAHFHRFLFVFADSGGVLATIEASLELCHIQSRGRGTVGYAPRAEVLLIPEKVVVHLPELSLLVGATGGLRCSQCIRMNAFPWKIPRHILDLSGLDIIGD